MRDLETIRTLLVLGGVLMLTGPWWLWSLGAWFVYVGGFFRPERMRF